MLPFPIISNTNVLPPITQRIVSVQGSDTHVMILYNNGELYARGAGTNFKLGTGTNTNVTDRWVLSNTNVRLFATSTYGTIVIKNDSTVWLVGRNDFVDYTKTGILSVWTDVSSFFSTISTSSIIDIKMSSICLMLLLSNGNYYGLGRPFSQQLGGNNTAVAPLSLRASNVTKIFANSSGTGYLNTSGALYRAGDSSSGQLGSSSTTLQAYQPALSNSYTVVDFYMAETFTTILCYLNTNPGSMLFFAAGSNDSGGKGDGLGANTQYVPSSSLSGMFSSFANNTGYKASNTFVLGTTSGIYQSGLNTGGIRGNGTTTNRNGFVNDTTGFETTPNTSVQQICSVYNNGTFILLTNNNLYYTGPGTVLGLPPSLIFSTFTGLPY